MFFFCCKNDEKILTRKTWWKPGTGKWSWYFNKSVFFPVWCKKTFILEKHRMVTNFANITFNSSFKNRQFHVNQFYKSLPHTELDREDQIYPTLLVLLSNLWDPLVLVLCSSMIKKKQFIWLHILNSKLFCIF